MQILNNLDSITTSTLLIDKKYFTYFLLFLIFMLFPPSLALHIYNFEYTIQYPVAFIILLLFLLSRRFTIIKNFMPIFSILLLLNAIFYIKSGFIPLKFLYGSILFLISSSFLAYKPQLGKIILSAHIAIAVILSIITVFQYLLDVWGIYINYFIETDYFRNGFLLLHPLFGVESYSGRYTSFFSEPNRFGFFLLIPFIFMFFKHKQNLFEYLLILLFTFVIILTQSVFTIFSILLSMLLYKLGFSFRLFLLVSLLSIIGIINWDSFLLIISRVDSFNERLFATYETIAILKSYPLGLGAGYDLKSIPGIIIVSPFTAINYWAIATGLPGLALLLLFIFQIFKKIILLINSKFIFYKLFAACFFSYFLPELWLQDMFGYLFLLYLSYLYAIAYRLTIEDASCLNSKFQNQFGLQIC